mgnify:CR=1 FL=1
MRRRSSSPCAPARSAVPVAAACVAPTVHAAAPEWKDNPLYDTIRQTYLLISDRLLGSVDAIEGVGEATREKLRFNTRAFVDAMSPSNFALTNPQVMAKAMMASSTVQLRKAPRFSVTASE